jgi:hypothetical protein
MLDRLKAFFSPAGEARLLRRIFWTGLLVRLLYITLAHTYRMRVIDDHFEFGWEMGRIARALATGHGFANPFNGASGPTAWTPPLYPLLLAGVFRLFGVYTHASGWVILAINSVFSAATATPIYRIARRCFGSLRATTPMQEPDGRSIALWSAWLWALYPAAMQYAVKWVWDMSLTAWLFAWVLVVALRLRGVGESCQLSVVSSQSGQTQAPRSQLTTANCEQRTGSWLLFGVLWGLIALANSSLLTFLPACGLWLVWPALHGRARLGVTLRNAALAALCFAAVISPWVIRNERVFHAFVPMRSNFGAELYEATIFSNDGFPWGTTLPTAENAPEFRRYQRLGELEFSRQQGARARAAIRAHPGLFAANALRRVYFFWIGVPKFDTGVAVEAARRINFAFFSVAGWLGLALALRRHVPGAWLFFWALAGIPFLYYFVTVQARFRHPLEPILCILSVYLFQSADRRRVWSPRRPEQAGSQD